MHSRISDARCREKKTGKYELIVFKINSTFEVCVSVYEKRYSLLKSELYPVSLVFVIALKLLNVCTSIYWDFSAGIHSSGHDYSFLIQLNILNAVLFWSLTLVPSHLMWTVTFPLSMALWFVLFAGFHVLYQERIGILSKNRSGYYFIQFVRPISDMLSFMILYLGFKWLPWGRMLYLNCCLNVTAVMVFCAFENNG